MIDALLRTESITVARPRLTELHRVLDGLQDGPHHLLPAWYARETLDLNAVGLSSIDPGWAELALRRVREQERGSAFDAFNDFALGLLLLQCGRLDEAAALLERFEGEGPHPGETGAARMHGLSAAVDVRTEQRQFDLARQNLLACERLAAESGNTSLVELLTVNRIELEHHTGSSSTARELAEAFVRDHTGHPSLPLVQLLLAALHREEGQRPRAESALRAAWRAVARRQVGELSTVLGCLLEGALVHADTDPVLAARLIALVEEHRGPLLVSSLLGGTTALALARRTIGEELVARAAAEVRGLDIPTDDDWDRFLGALRGVSSS